MKIKIRKDLRKRYKQWCKENDLELERAANNLFNNQLEEMVEIIDGKDEAPSNEIQE